MEKQPKGRSDAPLELFEVPPLLGVLSQLFQSRMAVLLAPYDLTYTQMAVLSHLQRTDEPQSVSVLAAAMQIQQPGMTKVVKRLEGSSLVTAESDPSDPRKKLVVIADGGRALVGEVETALFTDLAGWFDDWSGEEIASFVRAGWKLANKLDSSRAG